MRRVLITILTAIVYVLAVSLVLKFLPFDDAPSYFKSFFPKSSHSTLAWLKIRHLAVTLLCGSFLGIWLTAAGKATAKVDAVAVGTLAVIWGILFRWKMCVEPFLDWIAVTDYFVIWLALPLSVSMFQTGKLKGRAG